MKKVIVIGGGISGLAIALRLRAKNYQVTLLEKNENLGGKLNESHWEGFRWDTGPSLFTMPQLVEALFALYHEDPKLYLNYSKLHVVCKYFYPDASTLNAYADRDKFINECRDKCGVAPEKVQRYLQQYARLYNITTPLFIFRRFMYRSTLWSAALWRAVVNFYRIGMFRTMHRANKIKLGNDKLVQLFDRFATYNGSSPYKAPSTLNVISHLEFSDGAYFPDKGMYSIVSALEKLAREKGIEIKTNEAVTQVHTEKKRVTKVVTSSEEYAADSVVSGIDFMAFYKLINHPYRIPERLTKQERSTSAIIFYWAIDKSFPQLDLHNIFFSGNYREEFTYLFDKKQQFSDPTVYVFISKKAVKTDAPEGKENWFVMINAPENTGQDWDMFIADARKAIIKKLNRHLKTTIGKFILHESVADPRTIEATTSSYKGSLYGISSNNKMAAFYRHKNSSGDFKNLYFTGGSVHPGGGIPLCLASAKLVDAQF